MPLVSKAFGDIITFTRASTATYFDATGTLQSAAIDAPRFDYDPSTLAARGFLIEEARTNSIRNNTMVGAVAGTPGTLPTNWSITAGVGLSSQVVGTGTESGITYIDIRIFGTTAGAVNTDITFELTANVSALTGQTWTESIYQKLVGGTLANVSSFVFRFNEYTSGAVFISGQNSSSLAVPTSSGLATQRVSAAITLDGGATTAQLLAFLRIGTGTGAVDYTLRIGLPQLELGAFATSPIPTTTTALTRSADVASVNTLSPWFNATEGTLYAEWLVPSVSGLRFIAEFDDGTDTNRITLLTNATAGQSRCPLVTVTTEQAGIVAPDAAANTTYKWAGVYAANDFIGASNGTLLTPDTTGAVPTVTLLRLGNRPSGAASLNGYLRRITYYPRRLSNAELQSITT